MREFRLQQELSRYRVGGFALPLGIIPGDMIEPVQGYTVTYNAGEHEEPDTYTFHAVVSHERIMRLVNDAFELLPDSVIPIIEIGSRDAYRSLDVYVSQIELPIQEFMESWHRYKAVLLEDASIGIGANSNEPYLEVFLDCWKGVAIHAPLEMRQSIETLLAEHGLEEVQSTWQDNAEGDDVTHSGVREVLEIVDDESADLDELLHRLREELALDLNIDPESNCDETGRELGMTLWQAVIVAEPTAGDPSEGAYLTFWMTASSLRQVEELIDQAMQVQDVWVCESLYSVDRMAFDERPDDLADLPLVRSEAQIHFVEVDPWASRATPEQEGARDPFDEDDDGTA
ncbi:MAG: hypothetical protein CMJ32_07575 [Phycisphaerae bacterium]|nr:hypothetical protein [Phycisphaerae bacterium]